MTRGVFELGLFHPCPGEGAFVAKRFEDSHRVLQLGPDLDRGLPMRIYPHLLIGAEEPSLPFERRVSCGRCEVCSLIARREGTPLVAHAAERETQLEENGRSFGPVFHQGRGSAAQRGRSDRITPHRGALPRGAEVFGRSHPDRSSRFIEWPEVATKQICLLEVIANNLLLLFDSLTRNPEQPLGEPFMERGPRCLRDGRVRRIPYQHVSETEGLVPRQRRSVGSDQITPDQPHQCCPHVCPLLAPEQGRYGPQVELLAGNRRAPDPSSFGRRQTVQSRSA